MNIFNSKPLEVQGVGPEHKKSIDTAGDTVVVNTGLLTPEGTPEPWPLTTPTSESPPSIPIPSSNDEHSIIPSSNPQDMTNTAPQPSKRIIGDFSEDNIIQGSRT